MAETTKVTRAQKQFLREFIDHPLGPPAERWPGPAVLRRWLRRSTFRGALQQVRDALRFQADLHLAAAGARAAQALQGAGAGAVDPGDEDGAVDVDALRAANERMHLMVQLLRLAHLRARYTVDPPLLPSDRDLPVSQQRTNEQFLRGFHPDMKVHRVLDSLENLASRDVADFKSMGRVYLRIKQVFMAALEERKRTGVAPDEAGVAKLIDAHGGANVDFLDRDDDRDEYERYNRWPG